MMSVVGPLAAVETDSCRKELLVRMMFDYAASFQLTDRKRVCFCVFVSKSVSVCACRSVLPWQHEERSIKGRL